MGIDKSLSDNYPSVIINRMKYHYGREPTYGQYLVEHETVAKDYWCFDQKDDLVAFLVSLPESADRDRILRLYPDWHEVTPEQRTAYLQEDGARLRALAAERIQAGSAFSFTMDLEGEHGPHTPQRLPERSPVANESPLERVERELLKLKESDIGYCGEMLTDAGKLHALELHLDWTGVSPQDKRAVLAREVDFRKVTAEHIDFISQCLEDELFNPPDLSAARRLQQEQAQQVQKRGFVQEM